MGYPRVCFNCSRPHILNGDMEETDGIKSWHKDCTVLKSYVNPTPPSPITKTPEVNVPVELIAILNKAVEDGNVNKDQQPYLEEEIKETVKRIENTGNGPEKFQLASKLGRLLSFINSGKKKEGA